VLGYRCNESVTSSGLAESVNADPSLVRRTVARLAGRTLADMVAGVRRTEAAAKKRKARQGM
jgi:hypothetical protein